MTNTTAQFHEGVIHPAFKATEASSQARLSDKEVYNIVGPRDTALSFFKGTLVFLVFFAVLPCLLVIASAMSGDPSNWFGVLSLLYFVVSALALLCGVLFFIIKIVPAFKQRNHRMRLFDALKAGEIVADFHIPYKKMWDGVYFFIDRVKGEMHFDAKSYPAADLYKISSEYYRIDEKTIRHYIFLYVRNSENPMKGICMANEQNRLQQYERLKQYLNW